MAEFCLDCWNKLNEINDSPRRYVISRELDLCEGCGEYKRVIVAERLWSRVQKYLSKTVPFSKNETVIK